MKEKKPLDERFNINDKDLYIYRVSRFLDENYNFNILSNIVPENEIDNHIKYAEDHTEYLKKQVPENFCLYTICSELK